MTKYLYNGTFTVDMIDKKEITLQNGKIYDFNANDARVKNLVKLKRLTEMRETTQKGQK